MRLPSGEWSLSALRLSTKLLTSEDLQFLKQTFPSLRSARQVEAKALKEGLAFQARSLYLARWSRKTRRPESTFQDGPDAQAAFQEVALRCFESGISQEQYLACAEDTIRSVKYPTPQHLKGPFLLRTAKDWVPSTERKTEAGEIPILAEDFLEPLPVYYRIRLDRNWPGVYPATPLVTS